MAPQGDEYVKEMNAVACGGNRDWRIPSIKEQYSLILFSGLDVSGYEGDDLFGLVPFLDETLYFGVKLWPGFRR